MKSTKPKATTRFQRISREQLQSVLSRLEQAPARNAAMKEEAGIKREPYSVRIHDRVHKRS